MTIKVGGGGSPYPFPEMPEPLQDEGRAFVASNIIPHKGTLIDNIVMPSAFGTGATGDMSGRLNTSVVWTVNATDINAACDGFLCVNAHFYDSVNDRLYVFGVDTATTPDTIYTAYITLETGAITNVGSATLSTDPGTRSTAEQCAVGRPSVSSGNFSLYFSDRTIVINESTGAEVSNDASVNVEGSAPVGHYVSADGTLLGFRLITSSNATYVSRGGRTAYIPTPQPYITTSQAVALPWGDKVKVFSNSTATVVTLRTFNRAEFDAMLSAMADFGGLA
jgi:hypothetical protein